MRFHRTLIITNPRLLAKPLGQPHTSTTQQPATHEIEIMFQISPSERSATIPTMSHTNQDTKPS